MSKKLFYYGSTASFSSLYSSQFDGVNEYIVKSYNSALQPSAISYSCWIKTTQTSQAGLMSQFVFLGGSAYAGSDISIFNGKFYQLSGGAGGLGIGGPSVASVNTGAWVHVAGTFNSTQLRGYVNGALDGSINYGSSIYAASTVDLNIGKETQNNLANRFNGKIAAPAIFNKVLTLAEVQEVMAAKMTDLRSTSVGANLIWAGYYPSGQSGYPTITDYAGSSFNGTLTNMENTDINTDVPT